MQVKVLVIEYHPLASQKLKDELSAWGYLPIEASNIADAYALCESEHPYAVLLNLDLPDGTGLEMMAMIKRHWPQTVIIAMTSNPDSDSISVAEREGGFAILAKPLDRDCLRKALLNSFTTQLDQGKIIGQSPLALAMLDFVGKAAVNNASVLLEGESGTGKDLMAQAIHAASARAAGPFVALNCGAINSNLIESELFGHEKGAFTGAVARKLGRFERANDGTLFLDEVGELSLPDQVKLLRALQEHCIERIGGIKEIKVNIRVIAATNRDLEREVEIGNFRQDLYFRLAVMIFSLPPLRYRTDDVLPLARHFISLHSERLGKRTASLTPEAEAAMLAYHWPGNIRELENVIERTLAFNDDNEIKAESLIFRLTCGSHPLSSSDSSHSRENKKIPLPFGGNIDDLSLDERSALIKQALQLGHGNRDKAANLLGLSRHQLYRRMKKLGISDEIEDLTESSSISRSATAR